MDYPEKTLSRFAKGRPVPASVARELLLDGYIAHNGESFQLTPAGTRLLNSNHQENPS